MTLEDDLRTTLRDRAAEPPGPQPDLVGAVVSGVQRSNRRRAVLGATAAVLAVVVAVPVWLADNHQAQPARPAASPTPSPQGRDWSIELPFPLTPGWLPAGVGTGEIGQLGTNMLLQYEGSGVLSVEVGPVPGDWGSEGEEDHKSNVGSRPATVRTAAEYDGAEPDDLYVGVRWQLTDGQWVQVVSFGPRTEAQVLRFARGLRTQAQPAPAPPFAFAEMPPGLTLRHQFMGDMCFGPWPPTDNRGMDGLCVRTAAVSDEPADPGEERLTVAGRPATINESGNSLRIELGGGRVLMVQVLQEEIPLTRAELIRFAEGVRIRKS